MEEEDYTKANRPKELIKVKVTKKNNDAAAYVICETKAGLDVGYYDLLEFKDEESANKWVENSKNSQGIDLYGKLPRRLKEIWDEESSDFFAHHYVYNSFNELEILRGANLLVKTKDPKEPWHHRNVSEKVLSWVGDEHINWMKGEFNENWPVVAIMEYCAEHFPTCSLAYLAAQAEYNYYINKDNITVGYISREILLIQGRAERLAKQKLQTAKNAGLGGGDASAKAKTQRLNSFMEEIEALGDLFPRMNADVIEDKAFQNAVNKNTNLWCEGKGQKENYLSNHIRSQEPWKSRYNVIFHKTV